MSANLIEVGLFSGNAFASLDTKSVIGSITIDTTIEESYEDTLEVTEHPVEAGAEISDHSFKRPMELLLRCGWSDSSSAALLGAVSNLLSGPSSQGSWSFAGGAMSASDYVAGVYSQLLQLQESRQPITVSTGMRLYDSMLLTSIRVHRDQSTRYVLMVEATLRQLITVSTSTASVSPQSSQAAPAETSGTVDAGTQQLQDGSPASGGALPPETWN